MGSMSFWVMVYGHGFLGQKAFGFMFLGLGSGNAGGNRLILALLEMLLLWLEVSSILL